MGKVLLVTPKYIISVFKGYFNYSKTSGGEHIYTHSKSSRNVHVLIPSYSSFHSYLSGIIWVFIPSKKFTYFGAFILLTIYSFKENPSGSCYIYGEIISLNWYEISMLLFMDFQNPILHILIHAISQIHLYNGTYFVKLMPDLISIKTL